MKKPLFLVLAGDGINCERETAHALAVAGAESKIVHVNDVAETPSMLKTYDGLAIPGGFSFGDELGSGQIMALKIRYKLGDAFFGLVRDKKPVIGICNGFQVLVKLGLLPFPDAPERQVALAANESGRFMNRWVDLEVDTKSVCLWTHGLAKSHISLPVRHGEGRIVFAAGKEQSLFDTLQKNGQIPLTYTEDINGSYGRIAGLTDPTGVVLGLMPHPEAYVYQATHRAPKKDISAKGDGALIFENITRILEGREEQDERKAG
jgi:phosphoribosylformylglycinamidine synthase subunit PurQ / glutaminase